ncbi:MAG: hypothetical protein H6735_06695 [Alphaproteobacteria bacterium]|nr:hypothetical protein [Alphaproteobacteria bacterium]
MRGWALLVALGCQTPTDGRDPADGDADTDSDSDSDADSDADTDTAVVEHSGVTIVDDLLFDEDHLLVVPDGDALQLLDRDGVAVWRRGWTELFGECSACGGEGASADGDGLLVSFTTTGVTSGGAIGRLGPSGTADFRLDGFLFPHDAIRDPGDGTVIVPQVGSNDVDWVAGDGSAVDPVRTLDHDDADWPGGNPNGAELVRRDGRRYLLLSHRGMLGQPGPLGGTFSGLLSMWDITDPEAPTRLWNFPPTGPLATPHGAVVREWNGETWLLWAHSDGASDRSSTIGVALLPDPALPPTYVADLVPNGVAAPFDFLRGVELTADGELWLTDSGPGGGAGTGGARGRILRATMPVLAAAGATGSVPDGQVFVDVPVTLVRDNLRNPFEGWLWKSTFPR